MAHAVCLNRRLALALFQVPSTRCTTVQFSSHLTPKHWIRTITSSPIRCEPATPDVSFGKENDEKIAPYLKIPKKKTKIKESNETETTQPVAGHDDYEISGFIDRSKQPVQQIDVSSNNMKQGQETRTPALRAKPIRKSPAGRPGDFKKVKSTNSAATVKKQDTKETRTFGRDWSRPRNSIGRPEEPSEPEPWMIQKNALKEKFEEGWSPRKKLSPDAMQGIRGLHEEDPIKYSTELLAEQFKVSPEAIRRILKSKWLSQASPAVLQDRRERWAKRHDRIWDQQSELGLRPRRTRDKRVEDPEKFEQDLEKRSILEEYRSL